MFPRNKDQSRIPDKAWSIGNAALSKNNPSEYSEVNYILFPGLQ